jgi:membrane protease YdiL (CAAX protease family)
MSIKSIFVGPKGIRSGWRFLLFVLLAIPIAGGLQKLAISGLGYHPHPGLHPVDFLLSDGMGFVGALIAAAILAWIGKDRLRDFGLPLASGAGRLWTEGILWGVITVAALAGLIALLGGFSIAGLAFRGADLLHMALLWTATMIVLGFFEEYLFRGYALVSLGSGMGFWPAAVLLSAIFGGVHYFTKPMESVTDALSVGLIGLFLCLSFRHTGSLWFAAGFHAAFDFVALPLLGAPNTGNQGLPLDTKLLDTAFHGPVWLTGGPRGMEASVLIFPIVAVLFWMLMWRFPDVRWSVERKVGAAEGEEATPGEGEEGAPA